MTPPGGSGRKKPLSHERHILLLALAAGLPGVLVATILLLTGTYPAKVVWTVTVLVAGSWLVVAVVLRERVIRPLQTLSNMLAALREGDFSLRARLRRDDDALGLAMLEINLLADTLRAQRLGAMEATALLRAVMQEIDVAIFAFDEEGLVRLVNRAGEQLLLQPAERLIGRGAAAVGLADVTAGDGVRVQDRTFPARAGRWEVRRATFRQDGRPHSLLVIADVTRSLREEELLAWQRLVRVLSHEINNSLAPIKSIAGSLSALVARDEAMPEEARDDVQRGLGVIESRSDALSRFMSSYARLAKLPAPRRAAVEIGEVVRRAVALETRALIRLREGPGLSVLADADQLEQALINLVQNAADASRETGGGVRVWWQADAANVEVVVEDEGPGVSGSANLFVPFYTTKPDGSGIGLVLARQVAEGHGGTVTLDNRAEGPGAVAVLRLPRT